MSDQFTLTTRMDGSTNRRTNDLAAAPNVQLVYTLMLSSTARTSRCHRQYRTLVHTFALFLKEILCNLAKDVWEGNTTSLLASPSQLIPHMCHNLCLHVIYPQSNLVYTIIGDSTVCRNCVTSEIIPLFEAALQHNYACPPRWGPTKLSVDAFANLFGNDFVDRYHHRGFWMADLFHQIKTPVNTSGEHQHKKTALLS